MNTPQGLTLQTFYGAHSALNGQFVMGEAAVMDGESLEERVVREIETAVELSDAALAAFVAGEKRETYDVTEVFEYIFANLRGLRRGLQQVARQVEGLPPLPPDAGH